MGGQIIGCGRTYNGLIHFESNKVFLYVENNKQIEKNRFLGKETWWNTEAEKCKRRCE